MSGNRIVLRPRLKRQRMEVARIEQEATDDVMDLMAFFLISAAFLFEIGAEFTNALDWVPALLTALPPVISLIWLANRMEIVTFESDNSRYAMKESKRALCLYVFARTWNGNRLYFRYHLQDPDARRNLVDGDSLCGWIHWVPDTIVCSGYCWKRKWGFLMGDMILLW